MTESCAGPFVEAQAQDRPPPGAFSPAIGIVTITKDDPEGIRKTIRSVQEQDFPSYQHVVVDGGSSPDVVAFLRRWQDEDTRNLLVTDPPPGIYPAMNTGIRATSAPLVVMLNGGDALLPGVLKSVQEHHGRHGWRWAYGGMEVREPTGRLVARQIPTPLSSRAFRAGLQIVPHPSTYVSRELYDSVGLYRDDLGLGADQEFFLRACRLAAPALIPELLSVFETGGISSSERMVAREISWHRMRVASGTAFGGRSATDLLATAFLVLRRCLTRAVDKVGRMFRSYRTGGRPRTSV